MGFTVSVSENASSDLLRKAGEARKSANAAEDHWVKELLEHIAQEYERAAHRVSTLSGEKGDDEPRPETSIFSI